MGEAASIDEDHADHPEPQDEAAALSVPLLSRPDAKLEGYADRGLRPYLQEAWLQLALIVPIAGSQIAQYAINLLTIALVGRRFPTAALAAVALATVFYYGVCKMAVLGLAGALNTLASQAVGAERMDAMPAIFQRCLLFLFLHAIPMAVAIVMAPRGYAALGYDPEVVHYLSQFMWGLLAALPLELIYGTVNRTLNAMRVTQPQLVIGVLCTAIHWPLTHSMLGKAGVAGASIAYAITCGNQLWMLAAYVADMRRFASLAYSAAAMDCTEAWCWSITSLASGLLKPNGAANAAAWAVADQAYAIYFNIFLSLMIGATTRVGNALGAGDAWLARCCTLVVLAAVPVLWVCGAALLASPPSLRLVLAVFTQGSDPELEQRLAILLPLSAAMLLPDGIQIASAGVAQGMGLQRVGMVVNLVAMWGLGLPCALLLAFRAHWGVQGLMLGLITGVCGQAVAYLLIFSRTDWLALAATVAADHKQHVRAEGAGEA